MDIPGEQESFLVAGQSLLRLTLFHSPHPTNPVLLTHQLDYVIHRCVPYYLAPLVFPTLSFNAKHSLLTLTFVFILSSPFKDLGLFSLGQDTSTALPTYG